ncbi:SsgA family sporulation/cell division regulator [Streptomyces sp. NPDC050759]|uniref:SsgA family sporulation/cell division regulator n=1 Tax=Streptomyces sp. NPDC050759 TaxID=3365635 RepID=UPI0037AEF1F4
MSADGNHRSHWPISPGSWTVREAGSADRWAGRSPPGGDLDFSRELLIEGMRRPSGQGDVRIGPPCPRHGGSGLRIELVGRYGLARLYAWLHRRGPWGATMIIVSRPKRAPVMPELGSPSSGPGSAVIGVTMRSATSRSDLHSCA